jgi:hypothetical protein
LDHAPEQGKVFQALAGLHKGFHGLAPLFGRVRRDLGKDGSVLALGLFQPDKLPAPGPKRALVYLVLLAELLHAAFPDSIGLEYSLLVLGRIRLVLAERGLLWALGGAVRWVAGSRAGI